eukprot:2633377-Amphidinium_carterae.2
MHVQRKLSHKDPDALRGSRVSCTASAIPCTMLLNVQSKGAVSTAPFLNQDISSRLSTAAQSEIAKNCAPQQSDNISHAHNQINLPPTRGSDYGPCSDLQMTYSTCMQDYDVKSLHDLAWK